MSIYIDCKKTMKGGMEIAVSSESEHILLSVVSSDKSSSNSTVPAIIRNKCTEKLWDPFGRTLFYISDIHIFHHLLLKYPVSATDEQVKKYIHELVMKMLSSDFKKTGRYLLIGGDVSHSFTISTLFYKELKSQIDELPAKNKDENRHRKSIEVYAILGNHELWDFSSLQECEAAYKQLLDSLGFHFLCNSEMPIHIWRPLKWIETNDKNTKDQQSKWTTQYIDSKKEPDAYDKGLIKKGNLIIVGGTGFAGCNETYNANKGLYRDALNREQEIKESQKWRKIYLKGLRDSRNIRGQLVVLTHNPINDWMGKDFMGDENTIYFTGHTHKNSLYNNDEKNIHIYANNQIGYKNNVTLKKTYIYSKGNPFAKFPDGISKITSNDYIEFYGYLDEELKGNGVAERMIEKDHCTFYMIKNNGYYGFFLISKRASYICAGGRVNKINEMPNINYINDNFEFMVSTYIQGLSPYRQAQEKISEIVRKMNGTGVIHGCIVDIDFYNHIMVNPNDGTLTYYYSPDFGQVMTYDSVTELLQNHAPTLLDNYVKKGSNAFAIYRAENGIAKNKLVAVDRSDGMYGLSNKVHQVQRLFTCKVLRAWNDELIKENKYNVKHIKSCSE